MIRFFMAASRDERRAINTFLSKHNARGMGSATGYVAYYAAAWPPDGRGLLERLVAAAKICPLHTPQAAKFFGGEDWRHVYVLQRLAAHRAPENLLSRFLAWCLREIGRDAKVWYVATYADTGTFNPATGQPHDGAIYRAAGGVVYCGLAKGGGVEGYIYEGKRHSMRRGPRTMRIGDIPAGARVVRSSPKHRYCWAVGPPLARAFRRRKLEQRMARYWFVPAYQPRLLARVWQAMVVSCWSRRMQSDRE
jgi:hypothetical protein